MRHRTASTGTLYQYIYGVHRFSRWINTQPDQLIKTCQDSEGDPNPKALAKYSRLLDDFVGNLQAEGLAPGSISNHVKGVKALFRVNRLKLELPYSLSKRTIYTDRAPTAEALQQLIDIADIRLKVILSMLALAGFRIGTLVKLQYRHIRLDLEKSLTPIHIHVEAEITKGKYHDYDTFIGQEAAEYLRAYLEIRRNGSKTSKIPPENIHDETPIIRNHQTKQAIPLTPSAVHKLVHDLYIKTGLIQTKTFRKTLRPQNPQHTQILPHPDGSLGRTGRLHRIHDGTHDKHISRRPNERHRIPKRNLHRIRSLDKAQNTSQQNRRTQRNHTSMGNEPRRNPDSTSPNGTTQNHNRP
jgi:integrase